MTLYESGETVVLIGDVFPATITEMDENGEIVLVEDPIRPGLMVAKVPDGLPQNVQAVLFRALLTTRGLVVGYQYGGEVHRVELPVPTEETTQATHLGGRIGKYQVTAYGECRCKARMLSTWDMSHAFPGFAYVTEARLELVREQAKKDPNYGLVPQRGLVRYSRV